MLVTLLIGFFTAFAATALLVHFAPSFGHDEIEGVQKFHHRETPRTGGLALVVGLMLALAAAAIHGRFDSLYAAKICIATAPIFLAGLAEDLTRKVGPLYRLLAAIASSLAAITVLDVSISSLGIAPVDAALQRWPIMAVGVTLIALAGITHAFNIVDGYNGLLGGMSLIILSALAYVAFKVGDLSVVILCLATIGATLGFFIWNFPRGLIFCGDGGAYLLGFVAGLSALLLHTNSQVSPWFFALILAYPVWETVFSIYRRLALHGAAPGLPDSYHLHQLVYKRLVRWMAHSEEESHKILRNSLTAPYLWTMTLLTALPAVMFYNRTHWLILFLALFIGTYLWIYFRLLTFRRPKWLMLRGRAQGRKAHATTRRKE